MIMTENDSGLILDAKDVSENAMNLRSVVGIGLIFIVTSLCFLAVCRVLLAMMSVETVALLIWGWSRLNARVKSGRV